MTDNHHIRKLRHLISLIAPGLLVLSSYQRAWLRFDITAGLSVAAIALPVGIAYADLAGDRHVFSNFSSVCLCPVWFVEAIDDRTGCGNLYYCCC